MDDVLDMLHAGAKRPEFNWSVVMWRAADEIKRLRTLVADLLEWADHQSCAIDDGQPCDCGYDALAAEWAELRRG